MWVITVSWIVPMLIAASLQVPPRDVRAIVRGEAVISGVVITDEAQPRPVRHARVTLNGTETGVGLTTITDDRGQFVFAGLPAGRYTVSTSKDGWLTASYGAKKALRPGSALPVTDGQTAQITLRLTRGAVITGLLLDHTGQPSVGTSVRAMRYTMQNGERRLAPGRASATTDDQGAYRIYGLPPGDYVVGASWRPGFFGAQGTDLRLTTDLDVSQAKTESASTPPPDRTIALASTFFPGTTVPSQAVMIALRSGEERNGVDFTLQVVPTARVEGTLTLPGADILPPGIQVSLMATGPVSFPGIPFEGYRTTVVAPDGSFGFGDVAPGPYTVLARAVLPNLSPDIIGAAPSGSPQILWASTDVSVDGDAISGLSLVLTPGMTVSGQLRFEAISLPAPDLKTVSVVVQPVQSGDAVTFSPSGVTVRPDGRFTIAGVTPGRYRLTATFPGVGKPNGWTVRSALVNGVDALDIPFVVQPNQNITDASIIATDRIAQLTGRLQNAAGGAAPDYSIILFPTDSTLWIPQSRRIQSVRPAADGTFTFDGLAAGAYSLAAVDDVEPGEWFDPAFLQQLVASSMTVTVGDGERKVQDVRVGR
jgi:hypothetical protein